MEHMVLFLLIAIILSVLYLWQIHCVLVHDAVVAASAAASAAAVVFMGSDGDTGVGLTIGMNDAYNSTWLNEDINDDDENNRMRMRGSQPQRQQRRPKIAYASSITSCPLPNEESSSNNNANSNTAVIDSAAVWWHSIRRLYSNNHNNNNDHNYDVEFVFFVHPQAAKPCVGLLERMIAASAGGHLSSNNSNNHNMNTHILIRDTPFQLQDIQSKPLRQNIDKNGCCGRHEFMKLWSYTLEQYDVVIHTDLDVLFLQPIDPIIDMFLLSPLETTTASPRSSSSSLRSSSSSLEHRSIHNSNPKYHLNKTIIPSKVDFVYTRDYIQASKWQHTDPTKYGVQGGFFVVRPNQTVFDQMIDTIQHTTYSMNQGWGLKGYGGYWGQSQIQGFLSYMYGDILTGAVEVDRCRINTMIKDDPYFTTTTTTTTDNDNNNNATTTTKTITTCRTGESLDLCEDCGTTPMEEIYNIHYTTCWKPWTCPRLRTSMNPMCKIAHKKWFEIRQELELLWGQQDRPVRRTTGSWRPSIYLGYCHDEGLDNYIPMTIPDLISNKSHNDNEV